MPPISPRLPFAFGLALTACAGAGPGHGPGHGHGAAHPAGPPHDRHGHGGEGMPHDFSDVAAFVDRFEGPDRDAWQRPADVVALLDLRPGLVVADLGAGTGYFLPHLAPAVAPGGRVLALDAEPAMVAHMQRRAEAAGWDHVEARAVPVDGPGLAPASVDRVLVVNTWHHLEGRTAYAAKLRDALRPGGSVNVVDFTLDSPHGPPPEMRLSAEQVAAELAAAGLVATVVDEALPNQYVVVARLP